MAQRENDSENVGAKLRAIQQNLKTLEEALRQLSNTLTEDEQTQLSPEVRERLNRLQNRTIESDIKVLLPKENKTTTEDEKYKGNKKIKKMSGTAKK
jgi:hypothetical protein